MTRKQPPGTTNVDVASLVRALREPFETADADRAGTLERLANARTARGYMLQRKREDLAAALGPTAPAVTALDTSITANTRLAISLATFASLAAKPPPEAAPEETIVHGFVRDATGRPVAGVKVTLAQPKGGELATTSSARDGRFVLRHRAAAAAEVPGELELRVHDKRHPTPIDVDRGDGVAIVTVSLED
jgi:hypothetical protein